MALAPRTTTRPHMPGYGVAAPGEDDDGLMAWSWAEERLLRAHNYWLATVGPEGAPHVMAVWGVWADDGFVFSTGGRSRKARNLRADPRCVVHTEDASEPVVVEGVASMIEDREIIDPLVQAYATKYGVRPPDPDENPLFLVSPTWAFGVVERAEEFARSATRWTFSD